MPRLPFHGLITFSLLAIVSAAPPQSHAQGGRKPLPAEAIDLGEVRRKIAALAAPDETLPYERQAVHWLDARRERIVPQLIAALDDKTPRVAEECLMILGRIPPSKELTDALIAKAGDARSPLRCKAVRLLERSADDPRAARLLDQASTEADRFAEPVERARWAWLAGRKDRAVEILKPRAANAKRNDWDTVEAIRLLGEIGTPAGIALLEGVASRDDWGMAAEAYAALAKCDPANHRLTKDQVALLQQWQAHKESDEHFQKRMAALVRLNAQEIRPMVMQMLRDVDHAGQHAALRILTAWKEKEALPEIRRLMQDRRAYCQQQAVAACLSIDDNPPQAEKDVLALLESNDEFSHEAVLSGIGLSAATTERKVTMLRAARAKLKSPYAVPHALRYLAAIRDQDVGNLVLPLMESETDVEALAGYCEVAVARKDRLFAVQVRRAVQRLATQPEVSDRVENTEARMSAAGGHILAAAAAYDLKDAAADVQKLMRSTNPTLRNAAQATGAKLGLPAAMADLYSQLHAEDAEVRHSAATAIMGIKVADEQERAAREEAILACLGRPSEGCALRVLATCGREKSVKALAAILDDPDARRAVYAAWVLAQLPDKAAAKGLRRVAIFAMFYHQMYQQGSGIDFSIAPDLYFHQFTGRLTPRTKAYTDREGPVRIPDGLLQPFALDDAEQRYAVRCYRLAEVAGNPHCLDVDFLGNQWFGPQPGAAMDRTHVPLLREIAAADSHLERLMVRGSPVAHFHYRQEAAKTIAAITREKATYVGLAGEVLASDAFPQPYKNQDELLARFVVDRVRKADLPSQPASDRQWQHIALYRGLVRHLRERFGPQVVDAIRREAELRSVDLKSVLPTSNP